MAARNWKHMRDKVADEGRCRVCAIPATVKQLEAAHIIARAHARPGTDWAEHQNNCVPRVLARCVISELAGGGVTVASMARSLRC
jgi:hypothetical protein